MVSSIKITKLQPRIAYGHADNMVSAKNNEASNEQSANIKRNTDVNEIVRLNKNGSIRKKPGPKQGNIKLNNLFDSNVTTNSAQNKISDIVKIRKDQTALN